MKTAWALAAIGVTVIGFSFAAWTFNLPGLAFAEVRGWGWPAILGYTVLIMILGGLGVPPVVLILPAAAVWPFPVALGVGLTGGLGASVAGFLLSRHCLRETVEPRIPEKISRYEHRLETHGISTVLILRLLFYLFPPINWMLGISAIPLSVFVGATLVGMLPGTLVYLVTGKGVMAVLTSLGPPQLLGVLGVAGLLLLLWARWAVKE